MKWRQLDKTFRPIWCFAFSSAFSIRSRQCWRQLQPRHRFFFSLKKDPGSETTTTKKKPGSAQTLFTFLFYLADLWYIVSGTIRRLMAPIRLCGGLIHSRLVLQTVVLAFIKTHDRLFPTIYASLFLPFFSFKNLGKMRKSTKGTQNE